MLITDVYENKFIKAGDLQGQEATVTISRAEVEKIGDDRKLVLYFSGKKKGLVTNKTNANRIAHYYGPDTDSWIGAKIVLYVDLVDFQGKTVEAVRIKAPPKSPARKPLPQDDDPIEEMTTRHPHNDEEAPF